MIRVEVTRFFVGRDGHEAAISCAHTGPEDQGNLMVNMAIEECHKKAMTLPFADIREMTGQEVDEYLENEAMVQEEKRQRIAAAEAYFKEPRTVIHLGYADGGVLPAGTPSLVGETPSEHTIPKLTEAELVKALQDDIQSSGDNHYFPLETDPLGR